ncbi:hypothetical protein D3C85_998830 [compost metagenome]
MPDPRLDQQPVACLHRNRVAMYLLKHFPLGAIEQLEQMMMMPREIPAGWLQTKMAAGHLQRMNEVRETKHIDHREVHTPFLFYILAHLV